MRFGLSPVINAIGVVFVVFTVTAAVIWTLARRRELARKTAA
jgi:spermidine/putrescine transport system permease protein